MMRSLEDGPVVPVTDVVGPSNGTCGMYAIALLPVPGLTSPS
jgi:hypothetical protein